MKTADQNFETQVSTGTESEIVLLSYIQSINKKKVKLYL